MQRQGFARLKRAGITCTTLKDIRLRRRQLFLQSLKLEEWSFGGREGGDEADAAYEAIWFLYVGVSLLASL